MSFNLTKAMAYVDAIDTTGTPRYPIAMSAADDAGNVFDTAKTQAQVVGSNVISFAQGVDADMRSAISDSALLAQLVANARAGKDADPIGWFNAYVEVLENVGWAVQEFSWNDYSAYGTAAEVNEQIISVVTAALGPGATAISIITSAVNALKAMKSSSSWITIFSRESQKAKIARFQVGLASQDPNGDCFVTLLGCLIEAQTNITQVLFFKFREANARFRAAGERVSINRNAITALIPKIRAKTSDYQDSYLSSITNLPPPSNGG